MSTYVKTSTAGVYRRGNTLCYQVRDFDGRQKWRTRDPQTGQPFKTEKAAAKARAAELIDRDRGVFLEPSKITVAQHLDEWLLGLEAEDLSPNTLDLRRVHMRAYIKPALGSIPLQRLDLARIKRWRADLAASGARNGGPLSKNTVAGAARTLYTALEAAVEAGTLARNPAKGRAKKGKRQAEAKPPAKHWSADELQRFLATTAAATAKPGSRLACAQRLHALWVLGADSGARREELLFLRRQHLDGELVTFAGGRTAFSGVVRENGTKTGRWRTIRIDVETVKILEAWQERLDREREEARAAGLDYVGSDHLFVDELGAPLHPDTVSDWFAAAMAASGVTKLRGMHEALRHSCATLLLEAGVSEHAVAARLGHDNVATTREIYQHSTTVMDAQAASAIGSIVHGGRHLRAVS